jgi:hypothetical protein
MQLPVNTACRIHFFAVESVVQRWYCANGSASAKQGAVTMVTPL